MTKALYPLRFAPLQIEKRWGGNALLKIFNKQAAESQQEAGVNLQSVGESFELYEFGEDHSSVITNGFLAGNDLYSILETYLGDLVGDNIYDFFGNQFPLLIKYLDVEGRLSVQVHPTDEVAAERYDCLGKNEFWYVLDAKPDARIYMGLNRDSSAAEFYEKCHDGSIVDLMNVYHPRKGDCFYIKAGTVHAAEGGVVIAEIQENSDATLRLYDWGFENDPATRREMHLDEAIDCIDYEKYKESELHTPAGKDAGIVCDNKYFTINILHLAQRYEADPDNFNSCIIYMLVKGAASLVWDGGEESLTAGDTILVPAQMGAYNFTPTAADTTLLEVHIRRMEEDKDDYIEK